MSDLQSRLQGVLGPSYRIERELGGGGMSRVFLGEEVALGRRVVIKVLPPEMAAGVNAERFRREIQLAAKLQHPHIVPLLAAGSASDLLYYVMPFIEGESLRARLVRQGELPVPEVLRVLRDVVDAVAYAHRHGVVHRDIKPDNVLLSENHALVTDFGVAKAVSESTGQQALTSMGVALGTPAYMAPEQATADPHTDHRADIYAVGALAYEMLCGRPPFVGVNPQAVLAAHIADAPEPVTRHRATVPAALGETVMRCLEKKAADRWQRAEELLHQLEAMLTPTGGLTPLPAGRVSGSLRELAGHGHPLRVAALFSAGAALVLGLVYLLMDRLGLPDWVFAGAVALLAIGFPIMVVTGHFERRRAAARASGLIVTTPPGAVHRWITWRRSLIGGFAAFAGLGLLTAAYMAMRALGIGPVGTLVAAGVLSERDRLVLAEFDNRTTDSSLGPTVTELMRVGLSQSPVVRVLDQTQLAAVLARMQRPPDALVDRSLALEIAEREGLRAVITGDVVGVGSGFAISARVLSGSGELLTAQQEAAPDANGIFAAVHRLSDKLRERIGESLRTIRGAEPLDRVTTSSLAALRLYTQALRAENAGDEERAVALLEQAVALDTSFAMAYRKLGTILGNNFEQRARATRALTKAFTHRDRLTERERAYADGIYYTRVTGEREKAIAAYQTLLDVDPDDFVALNNTGVLYFQLHQYARALEYWQRTLAVDSSRSLAYTNVASGQSLVGDYDGAERTLALFEARSPGNPRTLDWRAIVAFRRREYDSAVARWTRLRDSQRGNLLWRGSTSRDLGRVAALRGGLREARQYWAEARAATEQRGVGSQLLEIDLEGALSRLLLLGDVPGALAEARAALARTPIDRLPLLDRPYSFLTSIHALAGDAAGARRWATEFQRSGQAAASRDLEREYREAMGLVALAERRYDEAVTELRAVALAHPCQPCGLSVLARGYDAAGIVDSALVYWERFAETRARYPPVDVTELPTAYRRLGELYEARGNRERAVDYLGRFMDLWDRADPELQPVVRDVRRRLARLVGEPGPR